MVYTALITFGASAVQLTDPTNGITTLPKNAICRRVMVEPLRANTHPSYVGTSAVTNDASGTGVIQELATPPAATVALDRFEDVARGDHNIDPGIYYVHGTTSEKCKATVWTI